MGKFYGSGLARGDKQLKGAVANAALIILILLQCAHPFA